MPLYVYFGDQLAGFVTLGYSRDPLDVCFGDQLAISARELMHSGWHTFSS